MFSFSRVRFPYKTKISHDKTFQSLRPLQAEMTLCSIWLPSPLRRQRSMATSHEMNGSGFSLPLPRAAIPKQCLSKCLLLALAFSQQGCIHKMASQKARHAWHPTTALTHGTQSSQVRSAQLAGTSGPSGRARQEVLAWNREVTGAGSDVDEGLGPSHGSQHNTKVIVLGALGFPNGCSTDISKS